MSTTKSSPNAELVDAIAKSRAEADQSLADYRERSRKAGPPLTATQVMRRAGAPSAIQKKRARKFGRYQFIGGKARFIVTSVTGWPVKSDARKSSWTPAQTVYAVLDRFYCYRIIREFSVRGGWHTSEWSRREAERLAERLNKEHNKEQAALERKRASLVQQLYRRD